MTPVVAGRGAINPQYLRGWSPVSQPGSNIRGTHVKPQASGLLLNPYGGGNMRRMVMRLFWLGVFGAVISLLGLCGSGPSTTETTATRRPVATSTPRPPAVKSGYQGGNPFGENVSQVVAHLNDECFMAFVWDDGAYTDFYVMDGVGITIESENRTRSGPTFGFGFLLDFTGDLIPEPDADLTASIVVCMAEETGVPFDSMFEWAYDNSVSIYRKGEEGYFNTVRGYFVGGFFDDDLMTIVVTDWP